MTDLNEKIQLFIMKNSQNIRNLDTVKKQITESNIIGIDMLNKMEIVTDSSVIKFDFNNVEYIKELYNDRLRNHMLTRKGEKLFDEGFGSDLYDIIFTPEEEDPNTKVGEAKKYIESFVRREFPELIDIHVESETKESVNSRKYIFNILYNIPFIGSNQLTIAEFEISQN